MGMPFDDTEDPMAEDAAMPQGAEDDMGGEEPMGMEDDGAEEYGLSGGGGPSLGALGSSPEENPTDRAFADTEMDLAHTKGPLDEMYGDARIGAMEPQEEPGEKFEGEDDQSMMPGAEMQEENPGKAMDMKEQLLNFLQSEAKARRERAEMFQNRAREYMKNGGQR